ncbi:hypothetical protein D917_09489 [Trichinella nativa]|uniref:Uncharacterized protein n=1 Tax=Trichinella nativa TaxID=6335 RepID=A0A1Y3EFS5_9BILA|nr:hypothetical protein D917_09489 [Trichinella nativa]
MLLLCCFRSIRAVIGLLVVVAVCGLF